MKRLSSVLALVLCALELSADPNDALQINVLGSRDVVVTTASGREADLRVRVTDRDNRPIAGAIVSAILPPIGPGGHFRDRTTIATQSTDTQGQADFTGIQIRNVLGEFTTTLKARRGESAGSTQVVRKVAPAPPAVDGFFSRRRVLMMSIAAAGIAAAVVTAMYDGESAAPAPGLRVTPGSPITTGPR
jgi:hypothetical protein